MATAVLIASPSWRFKRQQAWRSERNKSDVEVVIRNDSRCGTIPVGPKVECCLSQRSYIICYINVITFGMLSVTMSHVLTAKSPLELSNEAAGSDMLVSKKSSHGHFKTGKCQQGLKDHKTSKRTLVIWCYMMLCIHHESVDESFKTTGDKITLTTRSCRRPPQIRRDHPTANDAI